MDSGPSDDDAHLRVLADALGDALIEAVAPWLVSRACHLADTAGRTLPPHEMERLQTAAEATAAHLAPRVRHVLGADVDAGLGTPLATLRDGTGAFTAALVELGFAPARRDEFVRQRFPADVYDLGPATFSDIDPSLHEPGLVWGAARARVHLRRRRDAEAT